MISSALCADGQMKRKSLFANRTAASKSLEAVTTSADPACVQPQRRIAPSPGPYEKL